MASTGAVTAGEPYNLYLERATGAYAMKFSAFADWNDDGDFCDTGEALFVNVSIASNVYTHTASITVPADASISNVRLRIMARYSANMGNAGTCGCSTGAKGSSLDPDQGEIKDFEITVNANVACSGSPNVASVSPASSTKCAGTTNTLSLTGLASASGYTYQWKVAGASGGLQVAGHILMQAVLLPMLLIPHRLLYHLQLPIMFVKLLVVEILLNQIKEV